MSPRGYARVKEDSPQTTPPGHDAGDGLLKGDGHDSDTSDEDDEEKSTAAR